MNSRDKGKRGELELAAWFKERGLDARRGQQFKGGTDSPDVIVSALPGIHLECKRVEQGSPYLWLEQAIRDAVEFQIPVVAHRKNKRDWIAILRLEDLLKLVRNYHGPDQAL